MLMEGHYHNGYVTHDLDGVLEIFASRYGIRDFVTNEQTFMLKTANGMQPSTVRIALRPAIEIVQPVSGFQEQILPFLPEDAGDPSPRLNHIAMRRSDLAAMRKEIAELGLPVTAEINVPGVTSIYVNACESLGHYLEYVCADADFWEQSGR